MLPLLFAAPSWPYRLSSVPVYCRGLTIYFATAWTFLLASSHSIAEAPAGGNSSTDQTSYEKYFVERVEPLLREHCFECHSHESGDSSGNLMLDSLAGMLVGGSRGPSIVPAQPDQSLLLRAVLYDDNELQMPPSEKLDDEAIATFRTWLADGAAMPEALRGDLSSMGSAGSVDLRTLAVQTHWAYQPPRRWSPTAASTPASVSASNIANTIDAIIESNLTNAGLSLSPPADRTTLLRRLSYDLTGLPPTQAETEQFLSDPRDDQAVTSELIDRLLASPSFGERWARFWMDVSRYADNKGYVFQEDREYPGAHQYRTWLIEAFNQDLPYDVFVTRQLAADLLVPATPDQPNTQPTTDTASVAQTAGTNSASDEKPPASESTEEATAATSVARSSAIDNSGASSNDLPALGFLTLGRRFLNNRNDIIDDRLDVVSRGLMGMTLACARCHDHKYDPLTQADYYAMSGVFLNTDEPGGEPWPHRLIDSPEPRQSFILIRGSPGRHGDKVPRRFVSLLAPDEKPFKDGSGRIELAQEIVSLDNPLTARVIANRVWLQLTGSSLVESPSDLGMRSPEPQQLALLDQLAIALSVDQQWSLKSFIRSIVSSRVYQQRSDHRADCAEVDPANFLYWKMNRRRLEFEAFRDTLLARVGRLDRHMYGASEAIAAAPFSPRRTVYAYIDRQNLPQVFRTFDAASPDNHTPARAQTSVPQQGLYLLNSNFVAELAQQLADRTEQAAPVPSAQATWMFEQVLCRAPNAAEQTLLNEFMQAASEGRTGNSASQSSPLAQLAGALLAANELAYID
ncbi:MAG: PSD1 and planctomycete cytochrome C domain-containing protein [Pirellulaceae bacterium]